MAKSIPQRMAEDLLMTLWRTATRPGIKKAKDKVIEVYDKIVNPEPEKVVKRDQEETEE